MEKCSAHNLWEERLKQRDKDFDGLANSIESLQNAFLDEMEKLNKKIENIHAKLAGDLESGEIGWITRVNILETKSTNSEMSETELKKTLTKMLPWFATLKWLVFIIAPTMITGCIALIVGLITGKIQIIM